MLRLLTIEGFYTGPTGEVALSPPFVLSATESDIERLAAQAGYLVILAELPRTGIVLCKTEDQLLPVPYRLIDSHVSGIHFHGWLSGIVVSEDLAARLPPGTEVWLEEPTGVLPWTSPAHSASRQHPWRRWLVSGVSANMSDASPIPKRIWQ